MIIGVLVVALLSSLVAGDLPRLEDAKLDTFLSEVYGRRPVERPAEMTFEDVYPPETFAYLGAISAKSLVTTSSLVM